MKILVSIAAQFAMLISILSPASDAARANASIRVHMINGRTGKPISRKPVQMWILDSPNQFRQGHLEENTDSSGVATFVIPNPQPEYFEIHIGMGGYWEECSSRSPYEYSASDILDSGVVISGSCSVPGLPKASLRFQPKPGEVYLIAVHLNLWEWIRYCGRRNGCGD